MVYSVALARGERNERGWGGKTSRMDGSSTRRAKDLSLLLQPVLNFPPCADIFSPRWTGSYTSPVNHAGNGCPTKR